MVGPSLSICDGFGHLVDELRWVMKMDAWTTLCLARIIIRSVCCRLQMTGGAELC